MSDNKTTSLQNTFLVAMPNMPDPRFKHSVTYICEHNESGAMGLVINQPTNLTVGELLDQIDIENNRFRLGISDIDWNHIYLNWKRGVWIGY